MLNQLRLLISSILLLSMRRKPQGDTIFREALHLVMEPKPPLYMECWYSMVECWYKIVEAFREIFSVEDGMSHGMTVGCLLGGIGLLIWTISRATRKVNSSTHHGRA